MLFSLVLIVSSPLVGSFLGVVVTRLPEQRSWAWTRSKCDACERTLAPLDLVPILSWLLLRGRCRYCGTPIGLMPLFMELGAMAVAVWTAIVVPREQLVLTTLFGWCLLALAAIDWRTQRLPDPLTLVLGLTGLVAAWLYDHDHWVEHSGAAIAGGAFMLAIALSYRRLRNREGLGYGDAKLLAAIGAWVSLSGLPTVLLLGALLAMSFFAVRAVITNSSWNERLPFGPFLAAAAWLVWLYGPLVPSIGS